MADAFVDEPDNRWRRVHNGSRSCVSLARSFVASSSAAPADITAANYSKKSLNIHARRVKFKSRFEYIPG
jgi:hypothetical protein